MCSPVTLLLPCFVLVGWIYTLFSSDPSFFNSQSIIWVDNPGDKSLILMWTPYFSERSGDPLITTEIFNNSENVHDCFRDCEFTFDRNRIRGAHAVLFHAWHSDMKKSDLPNIRAASQLWILLDQESPMKTRKDLDSFSGIFNWTMTYRRDSDIFHPYGRIIKKDGSEIVEELQDFLNTKRKFAAGVISNCFADSKREVLIDELKNEGLQIDIFGKCGTPICPNGKKADQNCTDEFWRNLARDYKFYLAFENALCLDYVTEKFFRTMELGILPVVYGGADYDQIAPPNSYINVENFPSSKDLAKFLIDLDTNPDEYKKYFDWKRTNKVVKGSGACDLCEKLRKQKLERRQGKIHIPKVYNSLKKWWTHYPFPFEEKEACRKPVRYE